MTYDLWSMALGLHYRLQGIRKHAAGAGIAYYAAGTRLQVLGPRLQGLGTRV